MSAEQMRQMTTDIIRSSQIAPPQPSELQTKDSQFRAMNELWLATQLNDQRIRLLEQQSLASMLTLFGQERSVSMDLERRRFDMMDQKLSRAKNTKTEMKKQTASSDQQIAELKKKIVELNDTIASLNKQTPQTPEDIELTQVLKDSAEERLNDLHHDLNNIEDESDEASDESPSPSPSSSAPSPSPSPSLMSRLTFGLM